MIEPQTFYPEPEPPKTAGEMLAFARKGWDLSVEDVASNLNLGVAVINALERDQYDLLPGHTFVKGYIRSYAILLRLKPNKVIKRIVLHPESAEITSKNMRRPLKHKACDWINKPKNKSGGLLFKSVLVIILLAGVGLFGLNQLSHLDAEKLAVFLKLPLPEKLDKTNDNEFSLSTKHNLEI